METQYKEAALKPLRERKHLLESELNGINKAIDALNAITVSDQKGLNKELSDVNATSIVEKLKPKRNNADKPKTASSYNTKLKYPAKIKYALKKLSSATAKEMISYLWSIDKNVDLAKLTNGITSTASKLLLKGELEAEPVGKANKYWIKGTKPKQENNVETDNKHEEAA